MNIRCPNCMKEFEEEYGLCPYCGFELGTPQEEIYMLPQGTVLAARYVIGVSLGCGGFANTYKAWDRKLETVVAIKEFYYGDMVNRVIGRTDVILLSSKSGAVQQYRHLLDRFLDEARYTAKFNQHENIIHIYDFFEENQTAYYVMEHMEGKDLSHYLKEHGGSIDVDTTITILQPIMEALEAVHKEGMIHRDVSPDNIFLLNNGKIKLFDFGLAKFSEKDTDTEVNVKPGYTPPEQYDVKSRQGPWTDIYALGATMYRAITGIVPQESVMRRDEGDEVLRIREIKPEIPEYIDACLTRAMSLEPAFRFKTVEQFEEVLVSRRTVRSEKEEQAFRKKVRILTVSAVSLVILVCAFLGGWKYYNDILDIKLEPADLLIWVPVEETEDAEKVVSMYQSMCTEFLEAYLEEGTDENAAERKSKISVELVPVPAAEYADRLAAPPEGERLPDLYYSAYAAESGISPEPLEKTLKWIDRAAFYFLSDYEEIFPQRDSIPLGINVPVIYGNSVKMVEEGAVAEENSWESYSNGETAVYVGSNMMYTQVQEAVPGIYVVMPVQEDVVCSYTDCWSVNADSSEAELRAAQRLLYYWLGETSQDILHIQHVDALPINREMLREYTAINSELDFLEETLETASVQEQTEQELEQYYQELYQREFVENTGTIHQLRQWIE